MELSKKNNLWLYFYRYYVGDKYALPKSICPLFWKGFLGMLCTILSPVIVILHAIECYIFKKTTRLSHLSKSRTARGWHLFLWDKVIILVYIALTVVGSDLLGGFGVGLEFDGWATLHWWNYLFAWTVIPIISIISFLIIGGIVYGISKLRKGVVDGKAPQFITIPREYIKAKANKLCPTITWK